MSRIKYLEAIGQKPKRGRPSAGPARSKAGLVKLYVREGRSVRDVAAALGCSKDAVHPALRKYGIAIRPPAKRSRLRTADPAMLFSDLAAITRSNLALHVEHSGRKERNKNGK